jgi:hypothetical protein
VGLSGANTTKESNMIETIMEILGIIFGLPMLAMGIIVIGALLISPFLRIK